ncbi:MAG TPA: guanylate kinase [Planctomycetia bacterium]|nr:guanylate kinase [Planctomycetia bacterium]
MPNSASPPRGPLLVLSGPSGGGKTSLIKETLARGNLPLSLSISATSRPPRPGERDGVHYRFMTRPEFERLRDAGEFLEWAEVHGNLYGTPRGPVDEARKSGRWALLEIDVQGFRKVKQAAPDAISFFLRAPSWENYESRLRERGADDEATIARRLADARDQLAAAGEYDFQIVNENLAQAARAFRTLLLGLFVEAGTSRV